MRHATTGTLAMHSSLITAMMLGAFALATLPSSVLARQADHTAHDQSAAELIARAVAAPDRAQVNRRLDEGRKPAEVLAWSGIAPGMAVADVMPGLGYWTEMMADIVGPTGSVAALQPQQFYNDDLATRHWQALLERSPEASRLRYPFDRFAYSPESLDLALINNSYHDLYWTSEQYSIPVTDPEVFVAGLYAAMRPGGRVVVIDHAAAGGEPRATVDALHRIDRAVVVADFERAGFVLVDESQLLANPDDDHTLSVFDEAIANHTDRFMLKFQRPAA
ncbi:MAG: class I SAM-dependent methyltransferase [Erythrobacter sp.]|nr:class I SAM-dependent methyltransferase [Erythrobacter sp.]